MLETLFAIGFIPGTLGGGLWLLDRFAPAAREASNPLARYAVGTALGLLAGLPLLILAGWLGWFLPAVIGGAGWIVAILTRNALRPGPGGWDKISGALIVGALALATWNGVLATESILAGRDEGVYSNHAVHIARTGAIRAQPVFSQLFEGNNFALAAGSQAGGYFFDLERKDIYFQFPPSFALYLAQAFGIGGYPGLFWFNPLLAALNAVLFFGLARRLLSPGWAGLATVFFACNLPQLWIARITLSEVVTQTFILAGLALLHDAVRDRRPAAYITACLLLAGCTLVRVDAFLVVIAVAGTGLFLAQTTEGDGAATVRRMARVGALAALLVAVVAQFYGHAASPGYYADFTGKIGLMLLAAGSLTALAWVPLPALTRTGLRRLLARPGLWWTVAGLVGGFALYAWFIRPFHEPFANFAAGLGRTGRDYRENTLRDLGAYLSAPALVLGLVGFLGVLRSLLRGRSPALAGLLALWLVYAALYLYNPYISTDHVWKMRRYVPVVLPGFVLFAVWATARLAPRLKAGPIRRTSIVIAGVALLAFLANRAAPIATLKLDAGAIEFVTEVANAVPPDALVVALDLPTPLFGPLQLAERRDAIRTVSTNEEQLRLVREIVARESANGREIRLISPIPLTTEPSESAHYFHLDAPSLERTTLPPPRENVGRELRAFVAPLDGAMRGFAADPETVTIGANPLLGVPESGFHPTGYKGERPFRWTEGEAHLSLPMVFPAPPAHMTLQILDTVPGGSPVELLINNRVAFAADVPQFGGDFDVPVDAADWTGERVEFTLRTPPWVPAETYTDSTDERILGIQLAGIVIRFRPSTIGPGFYFGSQRKSAVSETGMHVAEIVDGQRGRWTNGNASFELNLAADFDPTRVEFAVHSISPAGADLEIRWNGEPLLTEHLASTPQSFAIDLPSVRHDGPNRLEIVSSSFQPADVYPGSTDPRTLGVMIGDVRLLP